MIRRSQNEYVGDKAELGIPWSDTDTAATAFETTEKQQVKGTPSFHLKNT